MLTVTITGGHGEGKTTLAALVSLALTAADIPHAVADDDHHLPAMLDEARTTDSDRLKRNAASIAGRLSASRTAVKVQTRSEGAAPISSALVLLLAGLKTYTDEVESLASRVNTPAFGEAPARAIAHGKKLQALAAEVVEQFQLPRT